MSKSYCEVLTTVATTSQANKLAKHLITQKLVACVQCIPNITSFYNWKGKFEKGKELLLVLKTKKSCVSKLEREIKTLHPYEIPQFVVLDIAHGSKDYLNWINSSCKI